MQARHVRSVSDAKAIVDDRGLTHVKVGLFDIDGVMRGKYMSKDKFFHSLDKGFSFCDVILGWDMKDQLYDKPGYTGWHTGYPDAQVRILPETCRDLVEEAGMLLFIAEFAEKAEVICPRAILRRVIQQAKQMGLSAHASLEYEFFLFNETPDSIRQKHYRNLSHITPDWFGYSMLRNSVNSDLFEQILAMGELMDFPIESLHTETGPGVIEAAISVDDIDKAADKAALFKTYMKVLAQKRNLMATFMAKWSSQYPGQSGHIHISLQYDTGSSAFYDPSLPHCISELQRHFIAGQQALMPELMCMMAPTINSYSRMVPGCWSPTQASWGIENRTTALRVISGSDKSQRVEYRLGGADANPYLALAMALGSGLYGISHKLDPTAPVPGNAYDLKDDPILALPTRLWDAAQRFKTSAPAVELFGEAFVEHFANRCEWEEREFVKHVSDWELARYFEII